ncbi:MAG TPA: division/cell wall cluster transcriptional repressor MraZ [Polyangiaceae bacterium]|nr:division/cell wall cluster transcriptional repressor MraZ [Polyangiaceae bacterium]
MFRGHFEHAIDAKGRTSLPSRFRDVLAATGDARMVLTPSPFDACLHLFPMKAWEEFEAKIAALPQFEPNVIRLRRLYVSAAVEAEVDKQGRVLVPNSLREHALLQKDVLFAGMGQMVELWAREKWTEGQQMTADERDAFRRAVAEQLRI